VIPQCPIAYVNYMWINPLHIVIHSACALMALSFSCSNYALCLFSILQVFLTKHYRNRRSDDPDFFLDFEEIYVIDSKTRSITRAKVVVSVPEGKKRDRRNDLLLIRDGGESFRIIDKTKRDDATTVIEREEWAKSRQDVEKHFRKLRDFDYSNWF